MALSIVRGVVPKAQKIVVYGVEGIGKTTLASQFTDPLFIDTEGGTSHLDVARIDPPPKSWEALLLTVDDVRAERPCATLVIDTADWAERLCSEHVCAKAGKPSIESWNYGKGYTMMAEEFGRLLDKLTDVAESGIHVALLAHSEIRKFEEPNEAGGYDRWELKLSKTGQKKIAPMVKEWADAVLFLNYKQIVENVAKEGQAPKLKARGGKRVIFAVHHACWDAKNRWGMPDESPLEWASIAPYLPDMREMRAEPSPAPAAQAPAPAPATGQALPAQWDRVLQLCAADGVSHEEVMAVSAKLGNFTPETPAENYPAEYLDGFVAANWPAFKRHVEEMRADAAPVPFDPDYGN